MSMRIPSRGNGRAPAYSGGPSATPGRNYSRWPNYGSSGSDPLPPYTPIPSKNSNLQSRDQGVMLGSHWIPLGRGQGPVSRPRQSPPILNYTPLNPTLGEKFRGRMVPHEGDRNVGYRDHRGFPTVGIGHRVTPSDRLKLGDRITDERKEELWLADAEKALSVARKQSVTAGIQDPEFVLALADVNHQLGPNWNSGPDGHKETWKLIITGRYAEAADEVLRSKWYNQTPDRVNSFRNALLDLQRKKR